MSRESAIEAVARALYGNRQPPWDDLHDSLRGADRKNAAAVIDVAAPHLAPEVLREAASDWQFGGWSSDFPKGTSRPILILGMAQRATDFLRARADRLEQP